MVTTCSLSNVPFRLQWLPEQYAFWATTRSLSNVPFGLPVNLNTLYEQRAFLESAYLATKRLGNMAYWPLIPYIRLPSWRNALAFDASWPIASLAQCILQNVWSTGLLGI